MGGYPTYEKTIYKLFPQPLIKIDLDLYKKAAVADVGAQTQATCTDGAKKYYSIDGAECGEVCLNPTFEPFAKVTNPNLKGPVGDSESVCYDQGFTTYEKTVSKGFGPIKVDIDLYDKKKADIMVV